MLCNGWTEIINVSMQLLQKLGNLLAKSQSVTWKLAIPGTVVQLNGSTQAADRPDTMIDGKLWGGGEERQPSWGGGGGERERTS